MAPYILYLLRLYVKYIDGNKLMADNIIFCSSVESIFRLNLIFEYTVDVETVWMFTDVSYKWFF